MQGGKPQLAIDRVDENPRSFEQRLSVAVEWARAKPQWVGRGGQKRPFSQQPKLVLFPPSRGAPDEVGAAHQPPSPRSLWLRQALDELTGIDDEIGEEGLPQISEDVMQEARRILRDLGRTPIAPMVYSTEDGEIAIDFRSSTSTREAVLIELGDDGGGACFAFIDGKGRRARYSDSSDLPDEFARAQLSALAKSF